MPFLGFGVFIYALLGAVEEETILDWLIRHFEAEAACLPLPYDHLGITCDTHIPLVAPC